MLYLHAIYLCRCASKNYTCSTLVQYYSMKGVPEVRMSEDGVCCKIVCLPVKFQDVKFKDPKFMKFS